MTVVTVGLPLILGASVFLAILRGAPPRTAIRRAAGPYAATFRVVTARVATHRSARRSADELLADVPDVCDLMAVAATAGANVRLAVEAVAARHTGPTAAVFAQALRSVAGGARLGDALADTLRHLAPKSADALRPLVSVAVDSERYGTPLAPALDRLGADLRAHRQHRAQERARRVPVRVLVPLVTCVLPAFAVLTVVPLLAGIARDALADVPATSVPLDLSKENP